MDITILIPASYVIGAILTFGLAYDFMSIKRLAAVYRKTAPALTIEEAEAKARLRVFQIATGIAVFWPLTIFGVLLDRRKDMR